MKSKIWVKKKKEIEKRNDIVDIVEKILEFNKQNQEKKIKSTNTKPNA